MAHITHATYQIRISFRCPALASKRNGRSLARRSGLAQPAPQPLRSRKLPRLSIRRAAPELRPLWAPERAPFCRARSGRTGPRGAPLFGQRAGFAGTALPGRTTLCQSSEAREGPSVERKGELKSAENCEIPNQLCRLGVAPARHLVGTTAAEHLRLSG